LKVSIHWLLGVLFLFDICNLLSINNNKIIIIVCRPPGVFEWDNYNKGTQGVLEAVVNATKKGAVTIVGT